MLEVRIEAPSLNRLRARYLQGPRIVQEELRAGMERGLAILREEVQAAASAGMQPVLARELRTRVTGTGAFTEGALSVGAGRYRDIIRWQDQGTGLYGPVRRRYEIRPRYAQALRFTVGGRTVFARRVSHPGVRAQRFFARGQEAARPRIQFTFRTRLGNVTKRLRAG